MPYGVNSNTRRLATEGAFAEALDRALLDSELDVTVSCVKDCPARTTGRA
ncbi:hypothetical protein ACPCTO_31005 [Streptomyces olivoreticuli]